MNDRCSGLTILCLLSTAQLVSEQFFGGGILSKKDDDDDGGDGKHKSWKVCHLTLRRRHVTHGWLGEARLPMEESREHSHTSTPS